MAPAATSSGSTSGSGPQTYTGTGVTTAPITTFERPDLGGLTFTSTNQWITNRINLFSGNLTSADKITLGNGGATTGVVQLGIPTDPHGGRDLRRGTGLQPWVRAVRSSPTCAGADRAPRARDQPRAHPDQLHL